MRVAIGLAVLAIVSVLVRSSGYTALADAIAMGYLAHFTTNARRSLFVRSTLGAVSVQSLHPHGQLESTPDTIQRVGTIAPIAR